MCAARGQEVLASATAELLAADAPSEEESAMDAEAAGDPGTDDPVAGPRPAGPAAGAPAADVLGSGTECGPAQAAPGAVSAEPSHAVPELQRRLAKASLRARFYYTKARALEAELARTSALAARLRRANDALTARMAAAAHPIPGPGPDHELELSACDAPPPGSAGARPAPPPAAVRCGDVVVVGAAARCARSNASPGVVVVQLPPTGAPADAAAHDAGAAQAAGAGLHPNPEQDPAPGPGGRPPRLSLGCAVEGGGRGPDADLASQTSLEWVDGLMRACSQGSQADAGAPASAAAAAAGQPALAQALALNLPGLHALPTSAGAHAGDLGADVEVPMALLCASQETGPSAQGPPLGGSPLCAVLAAGSECAGLVPPGAELEAALEQCPGDPQGLGDPQGGGAESLQGSVVGLRQQQGAAQGSSAGSGGVSTARAPLAPTLNLGLRQGLAAAERAERRGSGSPRVLLVSRRAAELAHDCWRALTHLLLGMGINGIRMHCACRIVGAARDPSPLGSVSTVLAYIACKHCKCSAEAGACFWRAGRRASRERPRWGPWPRLRPCPRHADLLKVSLAAIKHCAHPVGRLASMHCF